MYQLVYYETLTTRREGNEYPEIFEKEFHYNEKFRLRRNALHYLLEIVQSEYKEQGYATSQFVGGLYCYKSVKTESGRKIIEIRIKII